MLLSLAPLFLGNNLLLLNQLPDIDADREAGRLTLPMCLSPRAILSVLSLQWALALLLPALLALLGLCPPGVALSLLLAPLALWTERRCRQAKLAGAGPAACHDRQRRHDPAPAGTAGYRSAPELTALPVRATVRPATRHCRPAGLR